MIAFVELRPSGRWLVVLNKGGDLIYTRRVEPKAWGIFSPMVSKEQYDADRQNVLLSSDRSDAGTSRNNNVVPFVRRLGSAPNNDPLERRARNRNRKGDSQRNGSLIQDAGWEASMDGQVD